MRVRTAAAVAVMCLPALAFAEQPMMNHDKPVACARDTTNKVWRIQCDDATKVCLYAPNDELDSEGLRVKPLERARDCAFDAPIDRAKLEADGYKFLPGRADAPWGWTRDERGRVFQVNFDLHNRIFFGIGYTPQKVLENPLDSKRTSIDFGLLSFDIKNGPTRHRLRFVQGSIHMEPFSAEMVLAHYDVSHRFTDPLLRITTFVGEPSRHDLRLNLGMWDEVGGLELHQTKAGYTELYKHAAAAVTLDLWQSANLDSYARLRTGLGLEGQRDDANGYHSALTATSAFELDTVLDNEGFHNVRFELVHELPHYFANFGQGETTDHFAQRMHAKLQYEAIILAINDQPVSLNVAVSGEKRNDIPGISDQWAFIGDVGLRFNLWAPPRSRL
jgi:hypothetical protein